MGCGCRGGGNNKVQIKRTNGPACPRCGSPIRTVHKLDPKTRRLVKSTVCTNPKCVLRK